VTSPDLPFATHAPSPPLQGPPESSPLARELEAAHAELRRAALTLTREPAPAADPSPAARAMERALASLYVAFDPRADRLTAARLALVEVGAAEAEAASVAGDPLFGRVRDHLGRARAQIAAAEARLARVPAVPPPELGELCASEGAPRLHSIARRPIAPSLAVHAPPPAPAPAPPPPAARPRSFEELREAVGALKARAADTAALEAAPPPAARRTEVPRERRPVPAGFAEDVGEALTELAFVRERARECFEDVAMVGMQRAPLPGDPWRAARVLERRLLAAVDVIAALGPPAIEHVPRLLADAPLKDPPRAFALAMVLGCFAGRDTLAAAEHVLLSSERDLGLAPEIAAAWKLAPHDLLPLALRTLLRDPDPTVRAVAIDVLAYRGLATEAELAAAASDAPSVAAPALVELAWTASPALSALLPPALAADDAALRETAWGAMVVAGAPQAQAALRDALSGPSADAAALWLAIGGDDRDAALLAARAAATPTPGLAIALGWAGAAASIELLIDLLVRGDEALAIAAAQALDRITDAGLWEEAEISDDDLVPPDPPEPDVGEPRPPKLAAVVGDPRDPAPEPAPERVTRPSVDPARWRVFWSERGAAYDRAWRYRRGQPYSPLVSLAELDSGPATPAERRLLQRELVVRTGAFVRFDPHDLVPVQEEAIAAWRPHAARASSQPGRWVRPMRRP
jgi:hypothetical protein